MSAAFAGGSVKGLKGLCIDNVGRVFVEGYESIGIVGSVGKTYPTYFFNEFGTNLDVPKKHLPDNHC